MNNTQPVAEIDFAVRSVRAAQHHLDAAVNTLIAGNYVSEAAALAPVYLALQNRLEELVSICR
jgi:hypothetical protein